MSPYAAIGQVFTRMTIQRVAPFEPQDIVEILDAVDARDVDGVAVFGPETPSVRDAVKRVRDKGVPVVALVSDLPSSDRDHFVGIDNVSAGRTGATSCSLSSPRSVARRTTAGRKSGLSRMV